MIGIFLRWRQLGRRYFLPHLLLGMVAASLGLPICAQSTELNASSESPSSSLFVGSATRFDQLIRLQETVRRPSFTVDYWYQHAIRTVIRHLSFSLTPQAELDTLPLAEHKLVLIDSLQALLTTHIFLRQPPQQTSAPSDGLTPSSSLSSWRSKTHAIRAGPSTLLV
ncbi:secA translation cis-regulator SecM [Candidatus Pantoea persica]|uniref:secA translation cis-regulator SecM n=1 Tax=Candidatus Pantoea persica TaxID=2518128 RepID=UPI00215D9B8F|nr:secA translation cis-regulator SecM [Candidatus Pantoea persica]